MDAQLLNRLGSKAALIIHRYKILQLRQFKRY
jgi:hypothetical protein